MRREDSVADGARAALPLVLPSVLIGAAYGVAATSAGWSFWQTAVASVAVYGGAAQVALLTVLAAGGSVAAAVGAGILLNARFLAAGVAIGPSLRGSVPQRALLGQMIVDASLLLARLEGGRYGGRRLLGATLPQWAAWQVGTVLGALIGTRLHDPGRFGLDVLYPAFFVALLGGELRERATRTTALVAAAIALALTPVAPPGVPVVAACAAVLVGAHLP